jgi:hypothetical protein
MQVIRHSDKCLVKQENSKKEVEAEVLEFKEHKKLIVVLNKSIKLNLTWNGSLYEGKMAGLDFVSNGPAVTKTQVGRG